jgi:hypothetical protein
MTHPTFPLRLHEADRERGRELAESLHVSENRLYAELIHDGLLMREQMAYIGKLREIAAATSREDALAVLDKAANNPPLVTDVP